ncbi:MAG TPA: hypothetical protein VNS57_04005 [Steroidobacteraceae bacterium]|nr:hypothetical protein [Steroidobacteraceae bacterium]
MLVTRFVALSSRGKQPFKRLQHLTISIAARRKGARFTGGVRVMEIAAVMMLAAVIFGIVLQFDRQA